MKTKRQKLNKVLVVLGGKSKPEPKRKFGLSDLISVLKKNIKSEEQVIYIENPTVHTKETVIKEEDKSFRKEFKVLTDSTNKALAELNQKIENNKTQEALDALREDVFNRLSHLGGGSMNRLMLVNSNNPLTRYNDINLIGGSGIDIATSTDNQNKRVDFTFSDSSYAELVTINGSATTIATIAIPTDTSVMIEAKVVARRTGGTSGSAQDGAGYTVMGVYKNISGTATEIGESSIFSAEDQAGWSVGITPSSGNALIQVTGAADNNITWAITYKTYSISS